MRKIISRQRVQQETPSQATSTKVFISYSRRDMAWADWIVSGFQKHNIEPLIDREDIAKGEDFQERIFNLINQADTVVFLISPFSVTSGFCRIEVDYAESLNKRFVPLLIGQLTDQRGEPYLDERGNKLQILPPLERINWIPFTQDGVDPHESFGELLNALLIDLGWLREHTRLGENARRWEKSGRPLAQLLRGMELDAAEKWRDSHPKDERPPTELHLQLITESRKDAGRRRNVLVGSLIAGLVVAVGLGGAAFWQWGLANDQTRLARESEQRAGRSEKSAIDAKKLATDAKKLAEENQKLAEAAEDKAKEALKNSQLTQSRFLSDLAKDRTGSGDAVTGMLLALEALRDKNSFDSLKRTRPMYRPAQDSLKQAFRNIQEQTILDGHSSDITSAHFSPDGSMIVSSSNDKTVRLWDSVAGRLIHVFKGHTQDVVLARFSPNGRTILSGSRASARLSDGGAIRLWDVKSRTVRKVLKGPNRTITSAVFSPDSRLVASGYEDNTVRLWNAKSGQLIKIFKKHKDTVQSVRFSSDGRMIVSASKDDTVRVWGVRSMKQLADLSGNHNGGIFSDRGILDARFSPDGKKIIGISKGRSIYLWDLKSKRQTAYFGGHRGTITAAHFSPDGKRIVSSSADGTIRIWDATSGKLPKGFNLFGDSHRGRQLAVLRGHEASVTSVRFSRDGKQVFSSSEDGTIRLWDVKTGKQVMAMGGQGSRFKDARMKFDGSAILTFSQDSTLRVWKIVPSLKLHRLEGHSWNITSIAFSPDGRWIASAASLDQTVRLWDVKTRRQIRVLATPDSSVNSLRFSPDGQWIATGSIMGMVHLRDVKTGRKLKVFKGHLQDVTSVDFSPDGTKIVSSSGSWASRRKKDNSARLWDIKSGRQILIFNNHTDEVTSTRFSPDGAMVVSSSVDNTVRMWSAKTGKPIHVLKGHEDNVTSAEFSADGSMVVSASQDNTVRIWDVKSGRQIIVLLGPKNWKADFCIWNCRKGKKYIFYSATFTPDGSKVVAGTDDGVVWIWDVKSGRKLAAISGHKGDVKTVQVSPDGKTVATGSNDNMIGLWDFASDRELAKLGSFAEDNDAVELQTFVDLAKDRTPRCLTPKQRNKFYLRKDPPRWCITGPKHLKAPRMQWAGKWPYHTTKWQDWLVAKDREGDLLQLGSAAN